MSFYLAFMEWIGVLGVHRVLLSDVGVLGPFPYHVVLILEYFSCSLFGMEAIGLSFFNCIFLPFHESFVNMNVIMQIVTCIYNAYILPELIKSSHRSSLHCQCVEFAIAILTEVETQYFICFYMLIDSVSCSQNASIAPPYIMV